MYSIWLMPVDKEFDRYAEVIENLAFEWKCPVFDPHITLLSHLQEEPTDEQLYHLSIMAALVEPFSVNFSDFKWSEAYFKSFYLEVEPAAQLTELSQDASFIFPASPPYEFEPHLSLLYSDLPISIKQTLAETYGGALLGSMTIKNIALMQTQDDVETWECLEQFPLITSTDTTFDNVGQLYVQPRPRFK